LCPGLVGVFRVLYETLVVTVISIVVAIITDIITVAIRSRSCRPPFSMP
jgi:hypothetical protein